MNGAPLGMITTAIKTPKPFAGMGYRMQISVLDCTGCGNCVDVCPAKDKALVMKPLDTQKAEIANWNYAMKKVAPKDDLIEKF